MENPASNTSFSFSSTFGWVGIARLCICRLACDPSRSSKKNNAASFHPFPTTSTNCSGHVGGGYDIIFHLIIISNVPHYTVQDVQVRESSSKQKAVPLFLDFLVGSPPAVSDESAKRAALLLLAMLLAKRPLEERHLVPSLLLFAGNWTASKVDLSPDSQLNPCHEPSGLKAEPSEIEKETRNERTCKWEITEITDISCSSVLTLLGNDWATCGVGSPRKRHGQSDSPLLIKMSSTCSMKIETQIVNNI